VHRRLPHLPRPLRSSSSRLGAIACSAALLTAFAWNAQAAPQDKEAQKLFDQAINEDYLEMKFDAAIEKLNKAIKSCGSDGCSKGVLAKMYVGIGTVQSVGQKKNAAAKESLVKALEVDQSAKLLEDYTTDDLTKLFAEAK
jgi:hypothetical protein